MSTLKFENNGSGISTVILARPATRNAFESVMIAELTEIFEKRLNLDPSLRVVCLRGEGPSFSAGADLEWMKSMASFNMDQNTRDADALYRMFLAMRACPVPLIGRLHGHAMGGALGLAAVCDVAAAEAQTKFSFSEARLGLAPAIICGFVAEKMLPHALQRYALTAEIFSAQAAREAGLIASVESGEEALNASIDEILRAIAGNGPEAVRATKALLRATSRDVAGRGDVRALATRVIAERRVSAEGQEGMRAFFEKRLAAWSGARK